MSCAPGYTPREERLARALRHLMFKNHEFDVGCAGCLEVAGFLVVEGYNGDLENPTCVRVEEGFHYRDETRGLKHGRVGEWCPLVLGQQVGVEGPNEEAT